jgi:HPr kinase/phosphorylase
MSVHGALLDVAGVGVLLTGPSGIGKSECALELISRGHRLVADDLVELRTTTEGGVFGSAPERIRHYMEIRGIGIIFIPDLFGPEGVCEETSIDLVCSLEERREGIEYERIGFDRPKLDLAGVEVPRLVLPARPGGSMATIVEVAARDHLQRDAGVSAAQRLDDRLLREMKRS